MHQLGVALNRNTQERFLTKVLDPKNRKRVGAAVLKHYFGDDQKRGISAELDMEPSKENGLGRAKTGAGLSSLPPKEYEKLRASARKILISFQGKLVEELSKHDPSSEGILAVDDVI